MTDAIILAGGEGKRLGIDIPKALIPLGKEKLIDKQIKWLKSYGIDKIIVAEGYKAQDIQDYLKNKAIHSVEKEPLGTAGALKLALKYAKSNEVIVLNVDCVSDINLEKLIENGTNTICLVKLKSQYGVVKTKNRKIIKFEEKPVLPLWINAGVYFLNKNTKLPDKGSLEKDIFPYMELKAYKHEGKWYALDSKKDIEEYLKNEKW